VVLAPSAGVVANLRFPDAGGVVGPGEPILDIVPTGDLLLVDARVSPLDVDVVREGLEAQVRLPAFPGRQAPRIVGRVASVSPDSVRDEATGRPHFTARVEVPAEQLGDLALVPGMTAEVLIVTGERTLMGYLLEPIVAALRRGLREV
jgi:HlyD family type I secretion membrane fusion protein